jgi:hypothetical protein
MTTVPVSLPPPPGPRPVGDPGAMRALAAELRRVAHVAGRLGGLTFGCNEWAGYSANAFAARLGGERDASDLVGVELLAAARLLEERAEAVADELGRWRRHRDDYAAAVARIEREQRREG